PTFVDRFSKRHVVEIWSSNVADARKSGEQQIFRVPCSKDGTERIVIFYDRVVPFRISKDPPDDMSMGVDKTGQQGHVAEIDDPCARRNLHLSTRTNSCDPVVSHDNNTIGYLSLSCSVYQPGRL